MSLEVKGRSLGEAQSAVRNNELSVSKDGLLPPLFIYLHDSRRVLEHTGLCSAE